VVDFVGFGSSSLRREVVSELSFEEGEVARVERLGVDSTPTAMYSEGADGKSRVTGMRRERTAIPQRQRAQTLTRSM